MTQHQFTEVVTDANYMPLPSENPALEIEALDLAYAILKQRENGRADLAAANECRLIALQVQAEGSSRVRIESIGRVVLRDQQRRGLVRLKELDSAGIDESLDLLARIAK